MQLHKNLPPHQCSLIYPLLFTSVQNHWKMKNERLHKAYATQLYIFFWFSKTWRKFFIKPLPFFLRKVKWTKLLNHEKKCVDFIWDISFLFSFIYFILFFLDISSCKNNDPYKKIHQHNLLYYWVYSYTNFWRVYWHWDEMYWLWFHIAFLCKQK